MFTRRVSSSLLLLTTALACACNAAAAPSPAKITAAIKAVKAVGPEGAGNSEASQAVRELSQGGPKALTTILSAMDGSSDLADNWLRATVETIASRELEAKRTLPVKDLEKFLLNTGNPPRARRLAFELVAKADATRAEKLITDMGNDPAPELRRDAVGRRLAAAAQLKDEKKNDDAKARFKDLLPLARDVDQVDGILKQLKSLGEEVNLAKTFGFLTSWKVVGPFDSAGGKGFAAVYPPEERIDFAAEHDGKTGKVRWQDFTSKEEYGDVSMNLPFKPLKGVAAYAVNEFVSDKEQPVELRLGSENAFKVWLNGQFLFGQDEYHRNKAIDQYRMPARLKPGKNVILVKVCQNEQTEDWAGGWDFVLRVCDPLGAPIHSAGQ